MRTALIVSALLGLAVAVPRPQDTYDWDEIDSATPPDRTGPDPASVSEPVTYNKAAEAQAASADTLADLTDPNSNFKRDVNDACAPQPDGNGPQPPTDSDTAFLSFPTFASTALNAPTPSGYTRNFVNLNASSNANSYLGLYTFSTYDVQQCANQCNAINLCTGFNIYFERDPSLNPAADCPNPPGFTNIKCTLWGANVTEATAQNQGQYRTDFHVVIAGSNGYSRPNPPSSYPGYVGPTYFPCAINAPDNSYIGEKFFAGPYNAGLCIAACNTTNGYDQRHPDATGAYRPCNFFNAYLLNENGVPDGTACSLYTKPWDATYATNCQQNRGSDVYTNTNSFGFTRSPLDPGHV